MSSGPARPSGVSGLVSCWEIKALVQGGVDELQLLKVRMTFTMARQITAEMAACPLRYGEGDYLPQLTYRSWRTACAGEGGLTYEPLQKRDGSDEGVGHSQAGQDQGAHRYLLRGLTSCGLVYHETKSHRLRYIAHKITADRELKA